VNIAHHLDVAAAHFPDRPAILFEGTTLTYRQLQRAVDRAAHGLIELGIDTGDRVALFLPNIPGFAIAYLAVQKIGAIAVSVNVMLTTDELEHVLSDSGAAAIVTTAVLLPCLVPLIGQNVPAERVILAEGSAPGYRGLEELGTDNPFTAREMHRDGPAGILYTSGTTGKQKGAVLSHGNVVSNTFATSHALRVDPDDRLMLFLPLFHCFGQNFIMNTAFASGASIVLHRRFAPEEVLRSIGRDGVTMFFAVPTIYIGLLDAGVPPESLGGIRYYFSAAATMPVEIAERWRERFGLAIHEGYGLTETSPFASYNHQWHHRPGSVGTAIEMVEIAVVDAEDRPVAVGEWGEILVSGPNVMLGYWNRPEESAAALRGGWFHTGDVGYLDEDGYVFLVDRVKDMINVGGFKIWPREVEEVLYRHAHIKECAVVGVPDARKGEVAIAVVVLHEGAKLTADELNAFCREHMAAYKIPASFEFAADLPKSATGKTLKRVLRDRAVGQASA
jgi:long-chain acyl-CoA synthetase